MSRRESVPVWLLAQHMAAIHEHDRRETFLRRTEEHSEVFGRGSSFQLFC